MNTFLYVFLFAFILAISNINCQTEINDCGMGLNGLQSISDGLTGDYYLGNDIDCSNETFSDSVIPGDFAGTLDGKEYTISNVHIESSGGNDKAIFNAITGVGAAVYDLTLKNINVTVVEVTGNEIRAAGLAGKIQSGAYVHDIIARNVAVKGVKRPGAIAGHIAHDGTLVENVEVIDPIIIATVQAAGGFAGAIVQGAHVRYSSVENPTIRNEGTGVVLQFGGFAGVIHANDTTVEECSVNGGSVTITNPAATSSRAGGFAGQISHGITLRNCYARTSVDAPIDRVAGFVGFCNTVLSERPMNTIENSYSTGDVTSTGNDVGAFYGLCTSDKTTIMNSFFDTGVLVNGISSTDQTSGDSVTVENLDGEDGPFFTSASWDINNIWLIEADEFPMLRRAFASIRRDPHFVPLNPLFSEFVFTPEFEKQAFYNIFSNPKIQWNSFIKFYEDIPSELGLPNAQFITQNYLVIRNPEKENKDKKQGGQKLEDVKMSFKMMTDRTKSKYIFMETKLNLKTDQKHRTIYQLFEEKQGEEKRKTFKRPIFVKKMNRISLVEEKIYLFGDKHPKYFIERTTNAQVLISTPFIQIEFRPTFLDLNLRKEFTEEKRRELVKANPKYAWPFFNTKIGLVNEEFEEMKESSSGILGGTVSSRVPFNNIPKEEVTKECLECFVEGNVEDYKVKDGPFGHNFKFNKF